MNFRLLAVLLFVSSPLLADENLVWKDAEGKPAPETESRKAKDGFSGMLLVTPDADWAEKWNTPPENTPQFRTTDKVEVGGTITTLIFFANPHTNDDGVARIKCDFRVTRPDGSYSIDLKDVDCYSGLILGNKHNVRMTDRVLGFTGEPTDQIGEYITDVRLTDTLRGVTLDLRTRFSLVDNET